VIKLSEKIKSEASWKVIGDVDEMWKRMAQCIRRSAKEILGVSTGRGGRQSGAWWWNERVKEKVKDKQKAYATLISCTSEEEKGVRETTYKAAKKAVAIAKHNAYERLYQKLETKEVKKDVLKLARARERKTRDLGCIRCIKGEDDRVLVEETEIRER